MASKSILFRCAHIPLQGRKIPKDIEWGCVHWNQPHIRPRVATHSGHSPPLEGMEVSLDEGGFKSTPLDEQILMVDDRLGLDHRLYHTLFLVPFPDHRAVFLFACV